MKRFRELPSFHLRSCWLNANGVRDDSAQFLRSRTKTFKTIHHFAKRIDLLCASIAEALSKFVALKINPGTELRRRCVRKPIHEFFAAESINRGKKISTRGELRLPIVANRASKHYTTTIVNTGRSPIISITLQLGPVPPSPSPPVLAGSISRNLLAVRRRRRRRRFAVCGCGGLTIDPLFRIVFG